MAGLSKFTRSMNQVSKGFDGYLKVKQKEMKQYLYDINTPWLQEKIPKSFTVSHPVLYGVMSVSLICILFFAFDGKMSNIGYWYFFGLSLFIVNYISEISKYKKLLSEKIFLENTTKEVKEFIRFHAKALFTRKEQLVIVDYYRVANYKEWEKEKIYFIKEVVRKEMRFDVVSAAEISAIIETLLEEEKPHLEELTIGFHKDILPEDYEKYCGELLKKSGWLIKYTKATGDQGVDVIAEKNGLKVIIQCKRYNNPVGNKAVQEALAGKEFEGADYGVVVTSATFTKSAEHLASKTGILLMHHNMLSEIDKILR